VNPESGRIVVSPELSTGTPADLPDGSGSVDAQSACLGGSFPSLLGAILLDRVTRLANSGESDLSATELDDLLSLLSPPASSPLLEEVQQRILDEISPALKGAAPLLRGNSISPLRPISSSVSLGCSFACLPL
jgi:hypothetical protein